MHVVDEAVAVVVDAVRRVRGVRPHVRRKVRMVVVDPGVDYRDDHAGTGRRVPGVGRVDVGAGCSAVLADVVKAPLLPEATIVRQPGRVHHVIRLDIVDRALMGELLGHRVGVRWIDAHDRSADRVDPILDRAAGLVDRLLLLLVRGGRVEAHHQLPGNRLGVGRVGMAGAHAHRAERREVIDDLRCNAANEPASRSLVAEIDGAARATVRRHRPGARYADHLVAGL